MFGRTRLNGEPVDADYARASARWEPVVEVTQIKGDSEAHPQLSPDDPFAGFEPYPFYHQRERTQQYVVGPGDFARSGLKVGLLLEAELGVNPYQFGMIGSTDSHTGLATAEEPNFWGKMALDSIPERKQDLALGKDRPAGRCKLVASPRYGRRKTIAKRSWMRSNAVRCTPPRGLAFAWK